MGAAESDIYVCTASYGFSKTDYKGMTDSAD